MRYLFLLASLAACTPEKEDSGHDSALDTADTGLPSTCEAQTWYFDADGDGYGLPPILAMPITNCAQPSGYAAHPDDCNDSDANVYPGATDSSGDGVDQDCDGADG